MGKNLSDNEVILYAKDLTKLAIENNYLSISPDPKETALYVTSFYHTLLENINPNKE